MAKRKTKQNKLKRLMRQIINYENNDKFRARYEKRYHALEKQKE